MQAESVITHFITYKIRMSAAEWPVFTVNLIYSTQFEGTMETVSFQNISFHVMCIPFKHLKTKLKIRHWAVL